MSMQRTLLFLVAAALALTAGGCGKKQAACDMTVSSCTARDMLAVVIEAQKDFFDDHKRYASGFGELQSYLDDWPRGDFIIEEDEAKVFVPKDRSYEIRIKLYPGQTRLKISPQPQTPDGHWEPFCIMQRYDAKLLEKCDILK